MPQMSKSSKAPRGETKQRKVYIIMHMLKVECPIIEILRELDIHRFTAHGLWGFQNLLSLRLIFYIWIQKNISMYIKNFAFESFNRKWLSASMISFKKTGCSIIFMLALEEKRRNKWVLLADLILFILLRIENLMLVPVSFVWPFITKYRSQNIYTHILENSISGFHRQLLKFFNLYINIPHNILLISLCTSFCFLNKKIKTI